MTTAEVATVQSVTEGDVEQALATGIISIDAARRVGWAKAFEALRRVDALEEEVRQLRDERKALRRAYSRLVGFVGHLPGTRSEVFDAEFSRHSSAERTFRHDDAYDKGRAVARQHEAVVREWSEEQARAQAQLRATKTDYLASVYRELYKAASSLGHDIGHQAVSLSEWLASCSCGEQLTGTEKDVFRWKDEHAVSVVHGMTLLEFRKLRKQGTPRISDISKGAT